MQIKVFLQYAPELNSELRPLLKALTDLNFRHKFESNKSCLLYGRRKSVSKKAIQEGVQHFKFEKKISTWPQCA